MTARNIKRKTMRGFTLIELLIVIAILGVLAVVVLVAINPVQQLARTRDAGRESGATQLGHAVEAYAVSRNGVYPAVATWSTDLVSAGEISIIPAEIADSAGNGPCTTNVANGTWCYDLDTTASPNTMIVFAMLESQSNNSLCTTAGDNAYFVYASEAGRGGIVCGSADPTAAAFDSSDFVN